MFLHLFYVYECFVYMYMCVHYVYVQFFQSSEEGVGDPGTVMFRTKPVFSARAAGAFYLGSISPALREFFFFFPPLLKWRRHLEEHEHSL